MMPKVMELAKRGVNLKQMLATEICPQAWDQPGFGEDMVKVAMQVSQSD
jgi:hypothetical protein